MIEWVMLPDAHRAHRLIHRLTDASQDIQMLTHHLVAYFLHLTDGRLHDFDEMREEHLQTITCLEGRIATLHTQLDTQRGYYSDMLQDITHQRDSLYAEILSLRSTTSTLVVERDTLQRDLQIQLYRSSRELMRTLLLTFK